MFNTLLPQANLSTYRGHPIAKWVFIVITFITLARSLVHIITPDGGAQSIATIPLDTFTAAGAEAVIFVFGLWGISQLLLGFVFVLVIWRYAALIPLMYVFILMEYAMRFGLGVFKSLQTTGTAPGGIGNYVFIGLSILMLIVALRTSKDPAKMS